MTTVVSYSTHNQTYTETFTAEQAKMELIDFGFPDAEKLTDKECLNSIHLIYRT